MIEELEIIKGIVGDITGVGIWGFVGYIVYSLVKTVIAWGVLAWLVNKLIVGIFEVVRCPVTKTQYDDIQRERDEAKRESERVKHAYRILKEKQEKESVAG